MLRANLKTSKLELLDRDYVIAGEVGEFRLRITAGEAGIAPGGGFVIYPPITTNPHMWAMVRWQLGGVYIANDTENQWEAWVSRTDQGYFNETNAEVIRLLNHGGFVPAGTEIELVMLDTIVQNFAMKQSWFFMEEDIAGKGASAFSVLADYEPHRHVTYDKHRVAYNAEHCPKVDVVADKAVKLAAYLSGKPNRDGRVELRIRAEDRFGNCAALMDEEVEIVSQCKDVKFPHRVKVKSGEPFAVRNIYGKCLSDKVFTVEMRAPLSGLDTVSSPCDPGLKQHLYFGDLHGHSALSDGLNTGDHYFQHARDISFLDFVAITDHDRFDEVIIDLTDKYHDEGKFVTFYGRERGGSLGGHRNIYSLDQREVAAFTGKDLWEELPKHDVLIIPHHTNASTKVHWKYCQFDRHDPERERLIEVVQNRGSFEQEEIGGPIIDGGYGSSVYSALCMGRKFGFVGGTDTHRGNPGGPSHPLGPYYHRWKPFFGLTVILSDVCTRSALWDSLWNRRTYVTTGVRILVDFSANGCSMGTTFNNLKQLELKAKVCGTTAIKCIEVINKDGVVFSQDYQNSNYAEFNYIISKPAGFYYLRIQQIDGHFAYISPVWCE